MYGHKMVLLIMLLTLLTPYCESSSLSVDCVLGQGKGCGRTPVTKPQGDEEEVTVTVPTENAEHHRDNCTEDEVNQQGCLNDGICFVVIIDAIRILNCQCPGTHIGTRCELLDFQPGGQEEGKDRIATAGVAALTVAGVLFVTILIFIVIWRKRYLRKKEQNGNDKEKLQDTVKSNGSPSYFPQVRGEGLSSTARHNQVPEAVPLTTMENEHNSS
ncbi:uncharacterized protein LOC117327415 isoform X1 [Pecten maximus]|uniref:uncharacterized protein LOC117327415 isoform X1 n=1 Tax=Pecten maximus TaxID=6579 RepID=UPI0014580C59|nr:uncharacterized protein LOC117327415 isoform X1 [Pecten maximus]